MSGWRVERGEIVERHARWPQMFKDLYLESEVEDAVIAFDMHKGLDIHPRMLMAMAHSLFLERMQSVGTDGYDENPRVMIPPRDVVECFDPAGPDTEYRQELYNERGTQRWIRKWWCCRIGTPKGSVWAYVVHDTNLRECSLNRV